MAQRACATLLAALVLAVAAGAALAEDRAPQPAADFAAAEALLRAGDLEGASALFVSAARAEPGNAAWLERAKAVGRVVAWRRLVEQRPDDPAWDRSVESLHAFYLQEGLPALAVALDAKAHARRNTAESALRLVEAHLAAGQDVDAAAVATAQPSPPPRLVALHAVALARLGHADAARGLGAGLPAVSDATPPQEAYDRARLAARLGDAAGAAALLASALGRTDPSAVEAWRARARAEADFAAVASAPVFAKALETQPQGASACSGGTSCSGCPKRGSCGGKR